LIILLCAAAIGCDRSSPPPTADKATSKATPDVKASPTVAGTEAKAADAPQDKDVDATSKAEKKTPPTAKESEKSPATPSIEAPPSAAKAENQPDAADAKGDKATDASQAPEPKPEPRKPERVAIFTPGGPLLVDVAMTLDGRPFNQAFDEQLTALLEAADADDDGVATWKELMDNDEYLQAGAADRPAMNARQKRDAIEQYDLNDDGHVQRQEGTAWLGRDAGRSAAAFRVRSSRAYAPNARTHSRVWPFLDRDGDGELSAAELTATGATLLRLDADDDQVLTLDELASLREQLTGQDQMNAANDATRDAAIHLEPGYTIERLDYVLPDLYSPRQALSPESFPALPKLFEQLDESGEEWLDRDELARLLTVEPHVRLAVDFNSAPTAEKPAARVTLQGLSEEVKQIGEAAPDRLILALGETRLAISATGVAMASQPAMPYGGGDQNQLQLMVHDQEDALFEELDANGDGRLGTREMTGGGKRLAARDANGDEALAVDELPYSMIVAFMRGGGDGDGFYSPPRSAPFIANREAPAWFWSADFNADGDLSRREFLGDAARFQELDGDGDGFIDAGEAASIDDKTSDQEPGAPAEDAATKADKTPVKVN
jgi:Ca2+-binding EF-hand superfamily protein